MAVVHPKVTDFKGPRGQLQKRCGHCKVATSKPLSLCSGCRAVRYCCREHQSAHWPEHKENCKKIKKYRNQMTKEDAKIRNETADFMTPANAFETHAGHFWGLIHTRLHEGTLLSGRHASQDRRN